MEIIKNTINEYKEIISYIFWGGMTTLVSWGSYSVFSLLFRGRGSILIHNKELVVSIIIANILSWVCAVIFAFVANKMWVFESKSWELRAVIPEFIKFVLSRLFTGLLEIIAVPLLVAIGLNQTIMSVEGMLAKVLVSIAIVILNYFFSKLFVFTNQSKTSR